MTRRTLATTAGAVAVMLLTTFGISGAAAQSSGECHIVDESEAMATGSARALHVDEGFTGIDTTITTVTSSQIGPGDASSADDWHTLMVPADGGGIAKVTLFSGRTDGHVAADLSALSHTEAAVAEVDLLNGFIIANVVKGTAHATTTEHSAYAQNDGSSFGEVIIDGVSYTDVAPNTIVNLPADLFGEGSYVALHERVDDASFPTSDMPFYRSQVTVRMIHVHVNDWLPVLAGSQQLEIVVAEAIAYAQTPTAFCGGVESVGASAYTARVRTKISSMGTLVGWVSIPEVGGTARQQSLNQQVENLDLRVTETKAEGTVENDVVASSSAVSSIVGLCIRGDRDADECLVTADVLRVDSYSRANATAAYSFGSMVLLNLKVLGIDVCAELGQENPCKPAKNTRITIEDITITLNERYRDPPADGHTGYTVRGLKVEARDIGAVTVARAYSEASFT